MVVFGFVIHDRILVRQSLVDGQAAVEDESGLDRAGGEELVFAVPGDRALPVQRIGEEAGRLLVGRVQFLQFRDAFGDRRVLGIHAGRDQLVPFGRRHGTDVHVGGIRRDRRNDGPALEDRLLMLFVLGRFVFRRFFGDLGADFLRYVGLVGRLLRRRILGRSVRIDQFDDGGRRLEDGDLFRPAFLRRKKRGLVRLRRFGRRRPYAGNEQKTADRKQHDDDQDSQNGSRPFMIPFCI